VEEQNKQMKKKSPDEKRISKLALRILHLEDDRNDAELVQETLLSEGISCDVVRVETRTDFLTALEQGVFDIILADYALPSFDGLSALAIMKKKYPDIPFIFVSGAMGEELAIETLKNGATDYVLKHRLSRLVPALHRALMEVEGRNKRKQAEEELRKYQEHLEELVENRTAELKKTNDKLQLEIMERKRTEEALRESEHSYRTLGENLPGIVFRVFIRENSRIKFFNKISQAMTGYNDEELEDDEICSIESMILQEDRPKIVAEVKCAILDNRPFTVEYRFRHKDGSIRYFLEKGTPIYGKDGNPLYIDGVIFDITEHKQIEEKLKTASNEWRATFDASSDPIMLIDSEMKIIKANLATTKYLLKPFNEILGKTYFELFQGTDRPPAECPLEKMKKTKKHEEAELYLSERYIWVRVSFDPIFDDKGNLIMFVHIIRDITESKHAEEELRRLATTDKLTEAYNRIKFEEIIEREIERVKRYNQPLSMIMFDIDHFKKINDTYGHSAGDYVLKTIADIVRATIRKIDYLIRWGGEEFVIISSETNLEKAHALAERIRGITESYKFDTVGKVTVSFGVTEFKEGDTGDSFIKRIDVAMYKAKEKGRNRVEVRV
jgi:diguanylate cyclase (GGDEF)-like protein/PAS domain S-box-containing protein